MSSSLAPHSAAAPPARLLGGKYLTFALEKEEYGIQILKVREIIGWMEITALPGAERHVKGVLNLRGQVIAVVDLRTRFAMPQAQRTDQTCIIVVEITRAGRKVSTGLIVDRVSEVVEIPDANIEPPPDLGASDLPGAVLGMGKVGQAVKILLDIDHVLAGINLTQ